MKKNALFLSPKNSKRKKKLTLPDHNDSIHGDRVQNSTHDVHGGTIGGLLVPAAEEAGPGQGRGLGHSHELEG